MVYKDWVLLAALLVNVACQVWLYLKLRRGLWAIDGRLLPKYRPSVTFTPSAKRKPTVWY